MSSVVEQYARQEAEKAAAAERKAAANALAAERKAAETRMQGLARKLFRTGKHTMEEIADMTGLGFDEVQALCAHGQS